jgi:hypothetical protein
MVRLNSNQNIFKPFDIEKERAFVIQTQSVWIPIHLIVRMI